MRQKTLLLALVFAVCAACAPKPKTVTFPAIEAATTTSLIIERVELTDSVTTLAIRGYHLPKYWIKVAPETRLIADGKEYEMVGAEGVTPGKKLYMPADGDSLFVLKFAPLPLTTKQFDFSESDDSRDWQLFGIDLTGKLKNPYKKGLPRSVKPTSAKVADLQGFVYDIGETTVNIHLLGYRERLGKSIDICLKGIFDSSPQRATLKIDPQTGIATHTFAQYGTVSCMIATPYHRYLTELFFAPGEVVDVYYDLSCVNNHLSDTRRTDKPQLNIKPLYTKGSIYDALNNLPNDEKLAKIGVPSVWECAPEEYSLSADAYTDKIIAEYEQAKQALAEYPAHQLAKKYQERVIDIELLSALLWADNNRTYAYMVANNIPFSEECDFTPDPITEKHFKRAMELFDMTDPTLLICPYADVLSFIDADMSQYGSVKYLKAANEACEQAAGTSLSAQTLAEMKSWDEPFFARAAEDMQQRTEAVLAANSDKIAKTPDVPLSQLFDAIVAPHKGKVVVVDFWNTWCSPCCNALKENEPYKSGELASDDIVWIYIADQSSPLGTYLDMIPSIKGIHYRLNKEQMNHICGQFNINSIPSYVFVKRDGSYALTNSFRDHDKMVKIIKSTINQ